MLSEKELDSEFESLSGFACNISKSAAVKPKIQSITPVQSKD
jgi:hypothetical protein